MKAKSIIIAAVLSLQFNFLFAENNETTPTVSGVVVSFNMNALAPVIPGEATFEDATESNAFSFNFSDLAPFTPFEADFSDVVPEKNIDLALLAPFTPSEADFNDTIEEQAIDLSALAPLTPAEADFE